MNKPAYITDLLVNLSNKEDPVIPATLNLPDQPLPPEVTDPNFPLPDGGSTLDKIYHLLSNDYMTQFIKPAHDFIDRSHEFMSFMTNAYLLLICFTTCVFALTFCYCLIAWYKMKS